MFDKRRCVIGNATRALFSTLYILSLFCHSFRPKFQIISISMENSIQQQGQIFNTPKQEVPNATAVLVLGIISLVGCFCYVIPGLTCSIIALVLASTAKRTYLNNPDLYTIGSYKNLNAGRICAIIGLCLAAVGVLLIIVYFIMMGTLISTMPWKNFH